MTAWYNEPDPYAAAWLRNLIAAGLIAPGVVDERKIQDVEAWELAEFTQCHFFAGIGIWSGALRAAGWPDDAPIWTGSCPCQPFSNAGKRKGTADDRHLWPTWFKLIEIRKPAIVVGEQVASKDGLGWFDLVSADMEGAGYAIGASDLCAAGFGQAHLRQRLYFVGLANTLHSGRPERGTFAGVGQVAGIGDAGGLEHGRAAGLEGQSRHGDDRDQSRRLGTGKARSASSTSADGGLAVAEHDGRWCDQPGRGEDRGIAARRRSEIDTNSGTNLHSREVGSLDNADWLLCRNPSGEPSWRPVESGTFPLAHGIADRMGKLRAYGNALDFKTAQGFCEVVAEIAGIRPLAREYDL